MAFFRNDNEVVEMWTHGARLMSRRYELGDAVPPPTVKSEHADDYDDRSEHRARHAYAAFVSQLLRGGWQRVRDPFREPEYPDDPRDPAIEAALHESPDDAMFSVYADFLLERGHPRGTLMSIEDARGSGKSQSMRELANAMLMNERRATTAGLLGRLADVKGLDLEWHRGFIHRARLVGYFAPADALDALFELFRHPSARFLRELMIEADELDHQALVDMLLHFTPPPPLRKLAMYRPASWGPHYPALGELGTLGSTYPQLEDVHINASGDTDLHGLAIPRARRFTLACATLRAPMFAAILDAPWPALEELDLRFGPQTDCTVADALMLLDGSVELPRLRLLRVRQAPFADALLPYADRITIEIER
jgi:hypothetical protein